MGDSIRIAGTTLNFHVEGSGIPLLVPGSSIYYPGTFSDRLKHSFRIVCADLPHFAPPGPDFNVESISFDLHAECIETVRVAADLGRVVAAGHSHHGNVAVEYAKRYPGNVSHVVLSGRGVSGFVPGLRAGLGSGSHGSAGSGGDGPA